MQLSLMVFVLFALLILTGVVKQSAFGTNFNLGCPGVIDGGDIIGLSKIEYVDGVVYSVFVSSGVATAERGC